MYLIVNWRSSFLIRNVKWSFCPLFLICMFFFFVKGHNMLALMLDPMYKNMRLVTTYLGCEAAVALVANFNE